MDHPASTTKRRAQIFLTGLTPLVTHCIILAIAARF